jgi:hypothetical protein
LSIFATALSFDADDHLDTCRDGRKRKPCTCSTGPLVYEASHILPEPNGPRAGFVSLSEIPGFISRPGRELCGDEDGCPSAGDCCDRVWPWMRLWVWDGRETGDDFTGCPVLLDRGQVEQVHAYLGRWLERTGEAR